MPSLAGEHAESPLVRFPPLVGARFVARRKRFIADVLLDDPDSNGLRAVEAHVADPGRLEGVLVDGARLWLSGPYPPPRKLPWTVVLAEAVGADERLVRVSLHSGLANEAVPELVRRGLLPELPGADGMRREVRVGRHRFDVGWSPEGGPVHLVEIKTVSHRLEDAVGAWPDAPSERGRRHVEALAEHVRNGGRATLVFVTGRGDLTAIVPHRALDPAFARALGDAARVGVELMGVRLEMTLAGPIYAGRVAVDVTRTEARGDARG